MKSCFNKFLYLFYLLSLCAFLFGSGFAYKDSDILYDRETFAPVVSYKDNPDYLSYYEMLGRSGKLHSAPRLIDRSSEIIIIGDSRVDSLVKLSDPDISIITKPGCQYDWLESIGLKILKDSDLHGRKVYIMSGLNDLNAFTAKEAAVNMERVLLEYRTQTNADAVYLVEVSQIAGPYDNFLNSQIIAYNSEIAGFQQNVPMFSYLEQNGFCFVSDHDALHYDDATNAKITGMIKAFNLSQKAYESESPSPLM